jgi:hypothetical protein
VRILGRRKRRPEANMVFRAARRGGLARGRSAHGKTRRTGLLDKTTSSTAAAA